MLVCLTQLEKKTAKTQVPERELENQNLFLPKPRRKYKGLNT